MDNTKRFYSVGLPVAITVDADGSVTFEVDLSEVADFTENVEDGAYPESTVEADVLTVEAAATSLGNYFTTTRYNTVNPTA